MDKKLTIFDYLSQLFMIFGITIALLNLFCRLFGEDAQGYSSIFSLGSSGLSVATMMQFLLAIAIIICFRFVFMTDILITNLPLMLRIILMFAVSFLNIVIFIAVCGWFPVNALKAWAMFLLCFVLSCTISTVISVIAERQENRKLEEALHRLKQEEL